MAPSAVGLVPTSISNTRSASRSSLADSIRTFRASVDVTSAIKDLERDGPTDTEHSYPPRIDAGNNETNGTDAISIEALTSGKHRQAKLQMYVSFYAVLVAGWNDGPNGALLPFFQKWYDLSYIQVSTLFLFYFAGSTASAFLIASMLDRIGKPRSWVAATTLQLGSYIILACTPPFPVIVMCYALNGFSVAFQDAVANSDTASMDNAPKWLGYLHGFYGVGAFAAPLIATAILSSQDDIRSPIKPAHAPFRFFYVTSVGLAAINVGLNVWVYWSQLGRGVGKEEQQSEGLESPATAPPQQGKLRRALSNKITLLMAAFCFFYVGAEVSISGWAVSYLLSVRQASSSQAGYVAGAFWGAMTIGRFINGHIIQSQGSRPKFEQLQVYYMIAVAIALEFIIWFVPNFIGNAIAIALVGFIIVGHSLMQVPSHIQGPIYPVLVSVTTKLVPRDLHDTSVAFLAAFGQGGSAAFPFLTGALAQRFSVSVLEPLVVALFVALMINWFLIPSIDKRKS